MTNHRIMARSKSKLSAGSAAILLLAALTTNSMAQTAPDKDYSLTIMGFNIWNNGAASKMWDAEAKQNGELVYNQATKDLLLGVAPDVLVMPELYNNRGKIFEGLDVSQAHIANTLETLNLIPNKLGEYTKNADYQSGTDNGLVFTSGPSKTLKYNTVLISPGNGFPDTVIEGVHLNYYDEPTNRISQVKQLTEDAKKRAGPTIIAGDLNAGDLTERGLMSIRAQLLTIRSAGSSPLRTDLAYQYLAAGNEALSMQIIRDAHGGADPNDLSWGQWATALENAYKEGKDIGLIDETYAVTGNQPQTMNILKQNFQLLQLDRNREIYQPSVMEDQRATWTSDGEDATNTWPSWDRVNIDHILISRPFGKWVEIIDNGDMSGTLAGPARLPDGGSLSDHEPIAQELRWIGPKLETYLEGDTEKSKVIWGSPQNSEKIVR